MVVRGRPPQADRSDVPPLPPSPPPPTAELALSGPESWGQASDGVIIRGTGQEEHKRGGRDPWEGLGWGGAGVGEEAGEVLTGVCVGESQDPGGRGPRNSDRPGRGWAAAQIGLGEGMSHSCSGQEGLLEAVGHGGSRPYLEGEQAMSYNTTST